MSDGLEVCACMNIRLVCVSVCACVFHFVAPSLKSAGKTSVEMGLKGLKPHIYFYHLEQLSKTLTL